jgi:hypothetical protein
MSEANMTNDDKLPDHQRHAVLNSVENGLRGFVHFMDMAALLAEDGPRSAHEYWWYYTAAMVQGDMLFCSKVAGDAQLGAALRGLRSAGRDDLLNLLESAINARAINKRTLGEVIARLRNEMVHNSFDIEAQGKALEYFGDPDNETFSKAMADLLNAIEIAVKEIYAEHLDITLKTFLEGNFGKMFEAMGKAPQRARESELARRAKQRLDQTRQST